MSKVKEALAPQDYRGPNLNHWIEELRKRGTELTNAAADDENPTLKLVAKISRQDGKLMIDAAAEFEFWLAEGGSL